MRRLVAEDYECLRAARNSYGGWRPWDGVYDLAARLADDGLLIKAGITMMPPYVCYVITPAGEAALS